MVTMKINGGNIMFAKIEIVGTIEVVTGMHIGGSSSYSAIGTVDSPVIKDSQTGNPIIPGSSLKGKMRSLLAKVYNSKVVNSPDDDDEKLTRLFGSAKKNHVSTSRVLFSDMVMSNWEDLKKLGLRTKTEIKFENTINRVTAVANPRQIERVVRGALFPLSIIYEVSDDNSVIEDCRLLKEGFKLLEYDYIGGSGSRGYGKIKFNDLNLKVVYGTLSDDILKECRAIITE
jgi:CRISPR-associated protein Csm3